MTRINGALPPPRFMSFQLEKLQSWGAQAEAHGLDQDWVAPLAWYDSPGGFGEETWLAEMTDTVIAWQFEGSPVHCHWGKSANRLCDARSSAFTVHAKGTPNHFSAPDRIVFAQFYVPETLLNHVAVQLGGIRLSSNDLRDDLVFVADVQMSLLLNDYATRARSYDHPPTRLEMEARAILVVERLLTQHHRVGSRRTEPFLRPDWRVRRAIDYLEASLACDVGLAEVAAVIGLSTTQLTNLFRAGTGEPPHRWLMRRRFERACEMLADPRMNVTEVAHACGFASSQHLATVFQRRLGMTPSAYRRERLSIQTRQLQPSANPNSAAPRSSAKSRAVPT